MNLRTAVFAGLVLLLNAHTVLAQLPVAHQDAGPQLASPLAAKNIAIRDRLVIVQGFKDLLVRTSPGSDVRRPAIMNSWASTPIGPVMTCDQLCSLIDDTADQLADLQATLMWAQNTLDAVEASCAAGVIMHCDEVPMWEALVEAYEQSVASKSLRVAQLYVLKALYC